MIDILGSLGGYSTPTWPRGCGDHVIDILGSLAPLLGYSTPTSPRGCRDHVIDILVTVPDVTILNEFAHF